MLTKIKLNHVLIAALVLINAFLIGYFIKTKDNKNPQHSGNYSEIETVRGSNMDFGQLSNFFSALAKDHGGEYAYKSLAKAALESYIPPNIDLHLLGHVVGDELYKQQGIDGIKVCTNDLRNACSHSIVVGALLEFGEQSLSKIVDTCKLAPGGRGAYTMCIHGLGHGILAYTEYDMQKAIEFCARVKEPSFTAEYRECTGGIAMEMMSGINDPEAWKKQSANYFKKDDPLAPCNMDFMPDEATPICYSFLTPHLIEYGGGSFGSPTTQDYKNVFALCEQIPANEILNRDGCFGGLGREFPVLANDRNVQNVAFMDNAKIKKIYDWCSLGGKDESIQSCLNSSLQSLYWGGENPPGAAIALCSQSEKYSDFCFSNLFSAVNFYISDSGYRKQFCGDVPNGYQDRCKQALSV